MVYFGFDIKIDYNMPYVCGDLPSSHIHAAALHFGDFFFCIHFGSAFFRRFIKIVGIGENNKKGDTNR